MADVSDSAVGSDSEKTTHGLEQARIDVVSAIETQGLQSSQEDSEKLDGLVKVGSEGFSFELRFNGQTILLDGKETNVIAADKYQDFLKRQRLAAESGELDDQITTALKADGPMKALARVRAVDANTPTTISN